MRCGEPTDYISSGVITDTFRSSSHKGSPLYMINDWIQSALLGLIKAYRYLLSPWIGGQCRFTPTCSAYAMQALECYGPWRGSWLAVKRLARCHPLCAGGHDPVPGNEDASLQQGDASDQAHSDKTNH